MTKKKITEMEHETEGQFRPATGLGDPHDDQKNGNIVKRTITIDPTPDEPEVK